MEYQFARIIGKKSSWTERPTSKREEREDELSSPVLEPPSSINIYKKALEDPDEQNSH